MTTTTPTEQKVIFSLKCWSCGKEHEVIAPRAPQFAFEVVQAALAIDWKGVFDMDRSRALVFCSDACDQAARTKAGHYRARPQVQKVEA